jgi:hypothetical protein
MTTNGIGQGRATPFAEPDSCPLRARRGGPGAAAPVYGARRWLLIAGGWIAVALGTVGIFVPLLPTTCFLLTAAWCFGRTSPRFDRWLHENRLFGSYLTSYRTERAVPARIKHGSLIVLWSSMAVTVLLLAPPAWILLVLLAIAVAVSWHVGGLRSLPARSS